MAFVKRSYFYVSQKFWDQGLLPLVKKNLWIVWNESTVERSFYWNLGGKNRENLTQTSKHNTKTNPFLNYFVSHSPRAICTTTPVLTMVPSPGNGVSGRQELNLFSLLTCHQLSVTDIQWTVTGLNWMEWILQEPMTACEDAVHQQKTAPLYVSKVGFKQTHVLLLCMANLGNRTIQKLSHLYRSRILHSAPQDIQCIVSKDWQLRTTEK